MSLTQPAECFESGCPQAGKSQGFALPSGDPHAAKICLLLETPTKDEILYDISAKSPTLFRNVSWDVPDYAVEREYRRTLYPDCTHSERGAPVVGAAGIQLFGWALKNAGIQRRDCYIANVLQCYPGKKDGVVAYPIGKDRHKAESCCAKLWWKIEQEFKPNVAIINIHPAAIIRDTVAFPVQLHVFVQAKKFVQDGAKVLVACGGKAAMAWFGYGENVMRWAGHWQRETELTWMLRKNRLGC